jgi:crossover junction endodeoxyribonuclease RusA
MRLTLPYPPSANRYWRVWRGRAVKSPEARRYQESAAKLALAAGFRSLSGPVAIAVKVYRPRRRGDLDNALKVLIDALKGVAYADDEQVVVLDARRRDDKDNPRVEVEVEAA